MKHPFIHPASQPVSQLSGPPNPSRAHPGSLAIIWPDAQMLIDSIKLIKQIPAIGKSVWFWKGVSFSMWKDGRKKWWSEEEWRPTLLPHFWEDWECLYQNYYNGPLEGPISVSSYDYAEFRGCGNICSFLLPRRQIACDLGFLAVTAGSLGRIELRLWKCGRVLRTYDGILRNNSLF